MTGGAKPTVGESLAARITRLEAENDRLRNQRSRNHRLRGMRAHRLLSSISLRARMAVSAGVLIS